MKYATAALLCLMTVTATAAPKPTAPAHRITATKHKPGPDEPGFVPPLPTAPAQPPAPAAAAPAPQPQFLLQFECKKHHNIGGAVLPIPDGHGGVIRYCNLCFVELMDKLIGRPEMKVIPAQ